MDTHAIEIGTLVEIETGARLFVVYHYLDCDSHQTPLYCLSPRQEDTQLERVGFFNHSWLKGFPEESLKTPHRDLEGAIANLKDALSWLDTSDTETWKKEVRFHIERATEYLA